MPDCGCFIYQHRELRYEITSVEEGWILTVVEPDGESSYSCTYTKPNHPYLRTLLTQYLNGTDFSGLYWKTSSPIKFAVAFYPSFRSRICLYFDLTFLLQEKEEGTSDPIPCGIYIAPFATLIFTPLPVQNSVETKSTKLSERDDAHREERKTKKNKKRKVRKGKRKDKEVLKPEDTSVARATVMSFTPPKPVVVTFFAGISLVAESAGKEEI